MLVQAPMDFAQRDDGKAIKNIDDHLHRFGRLGIRRLVMPANSNREKEWQKESCDALVHCSPLFLLLAIQYFFFHRWLIGRTTLFPAKSNQKFIIADKARSPMMHRRVRRGKRPG